MLKHVFALRKNTDTYSNIHDENTYIEEYTWIVPAELDGWISTLKQQICRRVLLPHECRVQLTPTATTQNANDCKKINAERRPLNIRFLFNLPHTLITAEQRRIHPTTEEFAKQNYFSATTLCSILFFLFACIAACSLLGELDELLTCWIFTGYNLRWPRTSCVRRCTSWIVFIFQWIRDVWLLLWIWAEDPPYVWCGGGMSEFLITIGMLSKHKFIKRMKMQRCLHYGENSATFFGPHNNIPWFQSWISGKYHEFCVLAISVNCIPPRTHQRETTRLYIQQHMCRVSYMSGGVKMKCA